MTFTETTKDGTITRTYENGATVEFPVSQEIVIPLTEIPQPTNQEMNNNINTIMNVLFDMNNA